MVEISDEGSDGDVEVAEPLPAMSKPQDKKSKQNKGKKAPAEVQYYFYGSVSVQILPLSNNLWT